MSNETIGLTITGQPTGNTSEHKFFDPSAPEVPAQILGVDSQAIIRLGHAASVMQGLPYEASIGLHVTEDAVRIFPLIEKIQSGGEVTEEEVRPYRRPIKHLNPKLNAADRLASFASGLAIGIPVRRALNRKIEREFPDRAAGAIDQIRERISSLELEQTVDTLAKFDNPREEFVQELRIITDKTKEAARQERDARLRSRALAPKPELAPRGILGFITKIFRKIRSFFGFNWRKKVIENPEVTAYDVAGGLEKTLKDLKRGEEGTKQHLPMLSRIIDRLPFSKLSRHQLAFIAPEILNALFSAIQKNEDDDSLLDSVERNPHEFRFITRFKKNFGGYNIERAQHATQQLLPAIRDILPTEGIKIRQVFDSLNDLLQPSRSAAQKSRVATGNSSKTRKWFSRILKTSKE